MQCTMLVRGEGQSWALNRCGHRPPRIHRFFSAHGFLLMALTPKKRAFIDAVREGASNKNAAIAAGCPEKTASAAGSRLAKDPDVIAELRKLAAIKPVKADVKGVNAPADASEGEQQPEELFDLRAALSHRDPKDFLLAVMNDLGQDPKLRVDAAKALMPFTHQRKGEGGKKEQAAEKAAEVAKGRFGSRKPPQLKAVR